MLNNPFVCALLIGVLVTFGVYLESKTSGEPKPQELYLKIFVIASAAAGIVLFMSGSVLGRTTGFRLKGNKLKNGKILLDSFD